MEGESPTASTRDRDSVEGSSELATRAMWRDGVRAHAYIASAETGVVMTMSLVEIDGLIARLEQIPEPTQRAAELSVWTRIRETTSESIARGLYTVIVGIADEISWWPCGDVMMVRGGDA